MTYLDTYQNWLNEKTLLKEEKEALKRMDHKEIEEAFYQDISFGTGGIRGILGLGPNRINTYTIRRATLGLAKYLLAENKLDGVAIAYDNRQGSIEYAKEAAMVLAACGIKSYVFKSLRPTPMLSFAVRHFKTSAGIMLTASHNPKEYNGYKVYNETGAQLSVREADQVIQKIQTVFSPFGIQTVDNNLIHYIDESLDERYLNEVKKISVHHLEKTIKIVYSPLHGTGGPIVPPLLASVGYEVYPVDNQMTPDPQFTFARSSNPEEKEAYEESLKLAQKVNADVAFVTDPDADRLGVAVKHDGFYQLLNGNQTAAVMLYYLLKERKTEKGFVFTTVVTSNLIKEIAYSLNHFVGETLTGFKFIGEQAEKIKGSYPYLFGCEESYGSLVSDFVRDKDAVQAVFLLSEIANFLKQKSLTLIDYLDEIYEKYGYYVDYTQAITLKGLDGLSRIQSIMNYFREEGLNIPSFKVEQVIDYQKGIMNPHDISLPPSDVLKYEHKDGFIIFRPSGTEPKLKVYYSIKKRQKEASHSFVNQLIEEVNKVIGKI